MLSYHFRNGPQADDNQNGPHYENWSDITGILLQQISENFANSPRFNRNDPLRFQNYWRGVLENAQRMVPETCNGSKYITEPPVRSFGILCYDDTTRIPTNIRPADEERFREANPPGGAVLAFQRPITRLDLINFLIKTLYGGDEWNWVLPNLWRSIPRGGGRTPRRQPVWGPILYRARWQPPANVQSPHPRAVRRWRFEEDQVRCPFIMIKFCVREDYRPLQPGPRILDAPLLPWPPGVHPTVPEPPAAPPVAPPKTGPEPGTPGSIVTRTTGLGPTRFVVNDDLKEVLMVPGEVHTIRGQPRLVSELLNLTVMIPGDEWTIAGKAYRVKPDRTLERLA